MRHRSAIRGAPACPQRVLSRHPPYHDAMSHSHDQQARPESLRRRIISLPTILAFGVAVAFLWFLTTRFDLDWSTTWDNVRGLNPWLYFAAFISYYLSFIFRGHRWHLLAGNARIHASEGVRIPSTSQCSQLILIGWVVNSVTWLRLGDAYRAYSFSEESGGGFSWSLGTVLAERVLDMAVVLALLVVSAVFLSTAWDSSASRYIVIGAAIMSLGLLALTLTMKTYGIRLARFLPGRLEEAYQRFHQGTLDSFRQVPLTLFLGLIGWGLEITRLYLVVQALGLGIDLALVPVAALGNALLSTVPTPGGLGVVEPGLTGLLLLSLESNDALSVVMVDRSITYVSVIVVGGLVFLLRQAVRSRSKRRQVSLSDQSG